MSSEYAAVFANEDSMASFFSTMESAGLFVVFLAFGLVEGTELNQSTELLGVDLPLLHSPVYLFNLQF